jgi:hypothetical protein
MKKALLIMSLFIVGMLVGVPQATAQEDDQITVTVTIPSVVSVSLTPDSWGIGDVTLSQTVTSTSFTATNNGNVTEDFAIQCGDSDNWTCGTSAGNDVFLMEAQGGDLISWIEIDTSRTLETDLVKTTGSVSFTLRFTAPTDTTAMNTQQSIPVTVTASAAT